jgi:hypothetical protein
MGRAGARTRLEHAAALRARNHRGAVMPGSRPTPRSRGPGPSCRAGGRRRASHGGRKIQGGIAFSEKSPGISALDAPRRSPAG